MSIANAWRRAVMRNVIRCANGGCGIGIEAGPKASGRFAARCGDGCVVIVVGGGAAIGFERIEMQIQPMHGLKLRVREM